MEYTRLNIKNNIQLQNKVAKSNADIIKKCEKYPDFIVKKKVYTPQKICVSDSEIINIPESKSFSKGKLFFCAVIMMLILSLSMQICNIEAPEYVKAAFCFMTEIYEKEEVTEVENTEYLGAKQFIEVKEDENTDEEYSENSSFAKKIENSDAQKTEETEEKMVINSKEEETDVKITAKNMSPGSDKIYIANKTVLEINPENILKREYPIEKAVKGNDTPKVLIIHTHGTEAYIDTSTEENSRSKDRNNNVVRVGKELSDILNSYGIGVIHSKTMHDEISYVKAYENSKKEVLDYLKKYPTIEYVIDIHRDALGSKELPVKTYTNICGEPTAQLMFVMGTNAMGGDHPNYMDNLKVTMTLQDNANRLFPNLMRPMSIRPIIFNQNLAKGCMILEVGSDANTMSEALSAVRMFARVFAETI